MVEELIKNDANFNETDVNETEEKTLERFIDSSGTKPNAYTINNFGYTPLIHASKEGYVGLVKLLIDKGADVNAKTFVKNSRILRVLNLNTWGLGWPISPDRSSRLRALR